MNQFLLFKIGSYTFGLSANYLIEILNNTEISDNQINLRGKSIPVINIPNFFKYEQVSDNPKLLVLSVNNSTYALPIEDVSDIISVNNINIFNTPIIINTYNKYVKYVIKSDNSVYPILNLEALI